MHRRKDGESESRAIRMPPEQTSYKLHATCYKLAAGQHNENSLFRVIKQLSRNLEPPLNYIPGM
jgi:hypothetical protein